MSRERESKALTRALAPYRSGWQGELRAHVRCMLVRLMGFASCDDIPVGIRKIPHWFPGRSGLEPEEMRDMMLVAQDGLLELGYEAAAHLLTYYLKGARDDTTNIEMGAKSALVNLEGGPPSVMIGGLYPIIAKSIRRYKVPNYGEYLVGRNVSDPRSWYRFVRSKSVHNYTFQRSGNSLEDVLAAKYGYVALS